MFTAFALAAPALTPEGPATLTTAYTGPDPWVLAGPAMLTGWRAKVGFGGRAGTVRLRVVTPTGIEVLGEPVRLPAAPGTYTFPAPRVHGSVIGLDQTTGRHAIVQARDCQPERGRYGDPCRIWSLDVFRGDPSGPPVERVAGASLALEATSARDIDFDLLADQTEDRTDLGVAAAEPETDRNGRRSVRVTLTNAGSLTADLPALGVASPTDHIPRGPLAPIDPQIRWTGCRSLTSSVWQWTVLTGSQAHPCFPGPLPAGQSRTFTLRLPARGTIPLTFTAAAEGPDLHPEDNTISTG